MNVSEFKALVEHHIVASGITATRFGKQFASDPSFVFNLREGREPREKTRAKVMEAMFSKPSQAEAAS